MRREIKRISPPSWLDGGVAGLGAAALCAAFAFNSIVHTAGGSALGVATDLAYPIGDVLLLALVVAATTLLSGRGRAPWALSWRVRGIALNVVGDTFIAGLSGSSLGSSRVGDTFKLDPPGLRRAPVHIPMAVWRSAPARLRRTNRREDKWLPAPRPRFRAGNLPCCCLRASTRPGTSPSVFPPPRSWPRASAWRFRHVDLEL